MYIEKRWLVPLTLSLLLVGTFLAVVVLVLGSAASRASDRVIDALPVGQTPPCLNAPSISVPVVEVSTPAPEVAAAASAGGEGSSPQEVETISTVDSQGTQNNTRGFGDVGMQFQNVDVNGPINIVHISNQGNNNSNNVNLGDDSRILSAQDQLQSNRTDGAAPVAVAATGAPPTTAVTADLAPQPSAPSSTDTQPTQEAAPAAPS